MKCLSKVAQQTRESGDELKLLHQCMVQLAVKLSYKPILYYAYSFLKENNSAINRLPLGLYALFYRTHAKIMLPKPCNIAFFKRSRRLYGNHKSLLSCPSSGSLPKLFETIGVIRTIGTIGTIIWKPGLTSPKRLLRKSFITTGK